jgi:hypothetical protein
LVVKHVVVQLFQGNDGSFEIRQKVHSSTLLILEATVRRPEQELTPKLPSTACPLFARHLLCFPEDSARQSGGPPLPRSGAEDAAGGAGGLGGDKHERGAAEWADGVRGGRNRGGFSRSEGSLDVRSRWISVRMALRGAANRNTQWKTTPRVRAAQPTRRQRR